MLLCYKILIRMRERWLFSFQRTRLGFFYCTVQRCFRLNAHAHTVTHTTFHYSHFSHGTSMFLFRSLSRFLYIFTKQVWKRERERERERAKHARREICTPLRASRTTKKRETDRYLSWFFTRPRGVCVTLLVRELSDVTRLTHLAPVLLNSRGRLSLSIFKGDFARFRRNSFGTRSFEALIILAFKGFFNFLKWLSAI